MLKGGIRDWREKGYPLERASKYAALHLDGRALYVQHCASCHGGMGLGVPGHFPPLKDDAMMRAEDPWPAIWVSLYGLRGRPVGGKTWPATMGGFATHMSDAELAELLTYARREFGGRFVPVLEADVKKVRADVAAARTKGKRK